jgi:hypothetical protein
MRDDEYTDGRARRNDLRSAQLDMCPRLLNAAILNDENAISVLHRGQSMGDDDDSAAHHQLVNRILHQRFTLGIQRRCCLV